MGEEITRTYCHDCETYVLKPKTLEYVEVDKMSYYVHGICPNCGDKFYSPAKPNINGKGEKDG